MQCVLMVKEDSGLKKELYKETEMTFEEWKSLPYVKEHFIADDMVLRAIFKKLSEEEKLKMKE